MTHAVRVPLVVALAGALVCSCGGPSVELVDDTLEVVHVSPHHGAVEVELDPTIVIGFSEPLDPAASTSAVSLLVEEADELKVVDVRVLLDDDGLVVTVVPRSVLTAGARHRVVVGAGVRSLSGASLPAPFRAEFATRR